MKCNIIKSIRVLTNNLKVGKKTLCELSERFAVVHKIIKVKNTLMKTYNKRKQKRVDIMNGIRSIQNSPYLTI